MNILFVMKHRGNAGNTHAVANYMRVAPHHGHYGRHVRQPLSYLPDLKFSTDITLSIASPSCSSRSSIASSRCRRWRCWAHFPSASG